MTLDKDMLRDSRQWQLVMEPGPTALRVMAFSPLECDALISVRLPYAADVDPVKGFKDAVYDNPMLLGDFKGVTVILPSRRFLPMPDVISTPEGRGAIFRRTFPEEDPANPTELLSNDLPGLRASLTMEVDASLLGFIRRTFPEAKIIHPLTSLALYFKAKHPTRPRGKMLANLRSERVDIVILGDEAPLVLNSFAIHDPMDAVYYIMACREAYSLRPTDELILAGDTASRAAVTPHLRRFIRYVMPAIFPTVMIRAGRASLTTPFDLIVTPLV